jgi:hypothetical protein
VTDASTEEIAFDTNITESIPVWEDLMLPAWAEIQEDNDEIEVALGERELFDADQQTIEYFFGKRRASTNMRDAYGFLVFAKTTQ